MTNKASKVREEFLSLDIGQRLKSLRRERGHSLNDLAGMTGISEATLSRVENNQTLVSAHNLYILARILEVDVMIFFEMNSRTTSAGIRSLCRKGEGVFLEKEAYDIEFLCSDLSNKRMHPSIMTITRTELDRDLHFSRHEGDEYAYVLQGNLVLMTEFYQPLGLNEGDSVYFDSNMAHGYASGDGKPVRILLISTTDIRESSPKNFLT